LTRLSEDPQRAPGIDDFFGAGAEAFVTRIHQLAIADVMAGYMACSFAAEHQCRRAPSFEERHS
jgi:hypothetical protein